MSNNYCVSYKIGNNQIIWSLNYNLHRKTGPSVIFKNNGRHEWWLNGRKHRIGKPAIIGISYIEWWLNGKRHREDGPARIYNNHKNIVFEWWLNGKRHREDGPAVINTELKAWYQNGKLHRENGPAILKDTLKVWYQNGKLHREDGPAILKKNTALNVNDYYYNGSRKKYKQFIIKQISNPNYQLSHEQLFFIKNLYLSNLYHR